MRQQFPWRVWWAFSAGLCALLEPDWCCAQEPNEPRAAQRSAPSAHAPSEHGLGLSLTGGLNVAHPFAGAQAGWRFERATFLEVFIDYSYGWAISRFQFHTGGVGVRTHFAKFGHFGLVHQALLALAISGGGTVQTPHRDLGERLLGAFVTQGLGTEYTFGGNWAVALDVSTGYPVWLRSELAVRYTF
jgi:hypothetical protein